MSNGSDLIEGDVGREQERLRALARIRQRRYRERNPRIDFHPDKHAIEAINSMRTPYAGGDASSIINRIIREWSARVWCTPGGYLRTASK
jgi:hypothetical protein